MLDLFIIKASNDYWVPALTNEMFSSLCCRWRDWTRSLLSMRKGLRSLTGREPQQSPQYLWSMTGIGKTILLELRKASRMKWRKLNLRKIELWFDFLFRRLKVEGKVDDPFTRRKTLPVLSMPKSKVILSRVHYLQLFPSSACSNYLFLLSTPFSLKYLVFSSSSSGLICLWIFPTLSIYVDEFVFP